MKPFFWLLTKAHIVLADSYSFKWKGGVCISLHTKFVNLCLWTTSILALLCLFSAFLFWPKCPQHSDAKVFLFSCNGGSYNCWSWVKGQAHGDLHNVVYPRGDDKRNDLQCDIVKGCFFNIGLKNIYVYVMQGCLEGLHNHGWEF